ncbi:MAG: hypothetical protein AAFX05_01950 [Planctomycetota bacterium]
MQRALPRSPTWIRLQESDDLDRLVIERSGARKDRVYIAALVIFWLIWTPITIAATLLLPHSLGRTIWLVFGYVGVIVVPLSLLQLRGREVIEVTDDQIRVRTTPWPGLRWNCTRERLKLVSFEYYGTVEPETIPTVNLVRNGVNPFTERCMLASGLHPDHRREVFDTIDALLGARGYTFERRTLEG